MHVCRQKHGDGTLLTSILDLNAGITYLNFYHDYDKQIKFVLKDELAKGCLLYTSDAADERSSVDLGGRRIIKKKNKEPKK